MSKDKAYRFVNWIRNRPARKLVFVSVLVLALTFAPRGARAQFGFDPCCAILSAGLNTISGLIKNVVAKPLLSIQQIQQQAVTFEQEVVYPVSAIDSARKFAGQVQEQFGQMTRLYQLPTHSATLPAPQRLEQLFLSRDPRVIAQISESYSAVYGTVMTPADASPPLRDLVDVTDAQAQAALKKALELDALADVELVAADQINQQIQNAAPGSAPILEAEAAAWLVRANAYTQSAMAELVRLRSIELADASAQLKFSSGNAATLRNSTGQILGRTAR
jgi:hypothetical protein